MSPKSQINVLFVDLVYRLQHNKVGKITLNTTKTDTT